MFFHGIFLGTFGSSFFWLSSNCPFLTTKWSVWLVFWKHPVRISPETLVTRPNISLLPVPEVLYWLFFRSPTFLLRCFMFFHTPFRQLLGWHKICHVHFHFLSHPSQFTVHNHSFTQRYLTYADGTVSSGKQMGRLFSLRISVSLHVNFEFVPWSRRHFLLTFPITVHNVKLITLK